MPALTPRTLPAEQAHGRGLRDYAAPIAQRKSLFWNGGAAEAIERDTSGTGELAFELTRNAIYFTLEEPPGWQDYRSDGRQMLLGAVPPQAISIAPAGSRNFTNYKKEAGLTRYLAVFLDDSFLQRAAGAEKGSRPQLKPTLCGADLLSWQLARAMHAECEAGAPHGSLYVETATTMLSLHLLRHHGNLDCRNLKPVRGGLAPYQLKRVMEYIGDRLSDELSLEELAGLIGLSPHHFCRAFKHSTGLPPHRWQISQRVKKAQALMLDTTLSLAEIAIAAGFSDQSHLTTIFRKAIGTTPNAWRRATRR